MWVLTQVILALFSFLVVWLYVNYKHKSKCLDHIPGPPPNILFGNLLDFLGPTSDVLPRLLEYTKKYGEIVRIHDGPMSSFLLVSDYKFAEQILTTSTIMDKSVLLYKTLKDWLSDGLITSTGQKYKTHRRIITPAFNVSILAEHVEVFERVSDVFVEKLRKEVGKESFNIHPLIARCTLDAICETAMGMKGNAQEDDSDEFMKHVKTMCKIIVLKTFSVLPPFLYNFTATRVEEKAAMKFLHSQTENVIEQRVKQFNEGLIKVDSTGSKRRLTFLDMLLQSNVNGEPLSTKEIWEEVNTFMFAGHDTTSSATGFALYLLSTHPEVQQKVLEEQKEIFQDIRNAKVTATEIQTMKYLDMVLKEALRLYSTVTMIGRKLTEDFEFGGTVYPKGLNILVFIFAIHRNPKYFPDPEKFIPERFEDPGQVKSYPYIPFSVGHRNCIGQKFAMIEMKSIVSKIVRNFEICPSRPHHVLKLASDAVLVSINGVCLSLKERNIL